MVTYLGELVVTFSRIRNFDNFKKGPNDNYLRYPATYWSKYLQNNEEQTEVHSKYTQIIILPYSFVIANVVNTPIGKS